MKKLILAVAIVASGLSTFALTVNPIQSEITTVSISEEFKEVLQKLNDLLAKNKGKQYKQTPLMDNFRELCTLVG